MSTYYPDHTAQTPAADNEYERRSGWHSVNIGHLVMGLAFLGLVAVWGAVQVDAVPDDNVRWLLPLPWVFAGAAGLIAATVASGLRWRRANQEPAQAAALPAYEDPYREAPVIPDHTSDLDEKLSGYDLPAAPAAEEKAKEEDR